MSAVNLGQSRGQPRLAASYRDASVGGCTEATVEGRANGSVIIRSTEACGPTRIA